MKIQWEHFGAEFNDITGQWTDEDVDDEEFDDDDPAQLLEHLMSGPEPKQMIATPWGMFHATDPFIPFKRFELRIGYTDFNVGPKFLEVVANTEGVELVKAVSRYSFIIGIGRLFHFKDVRIAIEQAIGLHSQEIPEEVETLRQSLLEKEDVKWLIYVYPNGKYEFTTSEDPKFETTSKLLMDEKTKSNGVILKNV